MPKGQQKTNRETKKPKQVKKPAAPVTSLLGAQGGKPIVPPGKKP